jgi:hypothetical protein
MHANIWQHQPRTLKSRLQPVTCYWGLVAREGRVGFAAIKHLLCCNNLSQELLQRVNQLVHHLLLDGSPAFNALEVLQI